MSSKIENLDKAQLKAIAALQRWWEEPHPTPEDKHTVAEILADSHAQLEAAKVPQEVISAVIMDLIQNARRSV